MKGSFRRWGKGLLALAMLFSCLNVNASVFAAEPAIRYELYPRVHEIDYEGSQFTLKDQINIVAEKDIDSYTRAKIEQVAALKDYGIAQGNVVYGTMPVNGKTNILLGVYDSQEVVDQYFDTLSLSQAHLMQSDGYTLYIGEDVIAILGKDSDAVFYGITTLKEIFQQMPAAEIEQLHIYDYADIKGRGFIEGYYGNPWSVEDRAELMRYGGDLKLNNYIYAPKDDPYHNSNWRALYDEEKLKDIAYLAQTGNESKCYYVYALHTFMHNAVRFDSEEHYQEDLAIIEAKFTQVMDVGVRQFAILADDAGVPGGNPQNYVRLMNDLSAWMREKAKTVDGLKTDLIFCPSDYMGSGSSAELQTLKQLEDSISIIQTGGKIWGEVSPSFVNGFYNNMGRPVYMWINWPCSDNTKNSLIMDGNGEFLQPNIDPNKVDGIVLNPMQQSEANKSALFANADYSWNIWKSNEEARENWEDSFKYMDHQSASESASSTALRELSRHMKNSNTGDHGESTELAPKLEAFLQLLDRESYDSEADELIAVFRELKDYASYYKENPGNPRIRDQIIYWLECWEDSMDAGINFLLAAKALANEEDTNVIWDYFSAGQAALEQSKAHSFHYVDHLEYASVGTKYIQPFLTKLESQLSIKITPLVNPNVQLTTFITSRNDTPVLPSGKSVLEALSDGSMSSEAVWQNPNSTVVGDYIGIRYTKAITLHNITFHMGTNSNQNDTFGGAKIQYTIDGKNWVDVAGSQVNSTAQTVQAENLDVEVLGVRLIATADRDNMWLGCREIEINANRASVITNRTDTPEVSGNTAVLDVLTDGDLNTEAVWKTPDSTSIGDYIGILYTQPFTLNSVAFRMGTTANANDTFGGAKLQYTIDGITWTDIEGSEVSSMTQSVAAQELDLQVLGVRIIATQDRSVMWLGIREIEINKKTQVTGDITLSTNLDHWDIGSYPLSNLTDGDINTFTWLKSDGSSVYKDATITMTFHEGSKTLTQVRFVQNQQDKIVKGVLEYTSDGMNWQILGTYTDQEEFIADVSTNPITAIAVRVRNLEEIDKWWKACEFSVKTPSDTGNESMQYNIIKTPEWNEYTQASQSEANLHDGDDNTSAEYYLTGDKSDAGDYIGYDLGNIFPIGKVHIVVGGSRDASNKWRKYKLEYSIDNVNWTTYKEYNGVSSGKDVIDENLKGAKARYIRITNMQDVACWVHFSEFDVQEYQDDATDQYIYTNTDQRFTALHEDDLDSLNVPAHVTLTQGEYIGFKFARIKDLKEIVTDMDTSLLTLQVSNNGIHWETVNDLKHPGIGRYVRLINESGTDIAFNINEFSVTSNEVKAAYLYETDLGIAGGWGVAEDSRYNGAAFDGDVNTTTEFGTLPQEGQYAIYDLGQLRELYNIKLYNQDSALNYIRDAQIFVSDTLDEWGSPVMIIGDGVENQNDGNISALQSGLYKTSSTYPNKVYAESMEFTKTARYLKILFTASNRNRAVLFNEIVLNNGEYVRPYNDPTFECDPIEVQGFDPHHLNDGDLQSSFKQNSEAGTGGRLLYRISENNETKRINIIQSGATISNASVSVRGYRHGETVISEQQIGVLDRTMNGLEIYDFDYVFEIEIVWNDVAPTLQEIILYEDYDLVNGDISDLKAAYDLHEAKLNTDIYTKSSFASFSEAMRSAKQVIEMPIRTQYLINDTLAKLNKAVNALQEKADNIKDFVKLTETAGTYQKKDYAQSTWDDFADALAKARVIYEALDDCVQEQVDEAYELLRKAADALVSKQSIQQQLTYLDQIKTAYPASDYTKHSHDALLAKTAEYEAILKDETTITNAAFANLQNDIDALIAALIDLRPLKEAIGEAEQNYGESAYDAAAWKEYGKQLDEARAVLKKEDATKEEINDAIQACKDAKALLQADALRALENEITRIAGIAQESEGVKLYSDASYASLQELLDDARAYAQGTATDEAASFAWIEQLQKGEKDLVDLRSLRTLTDTILDDMEETWYTSASWKNLIQMIDEAKDLLEDENVSQKAIDDQRQKLLDGKAALVDLRELKKAIAQAQGIDDLSVYTPRSVEALTVALDTALAVSTKENSSADETMQACDALNQAYAQLVIKANKEEAAALLKEYEPLLQKKEEYSESSFDLFAQAYAALHSLYEDVNTSQTQMEKAVRELREAVDGLAKLIVRVDEQTNIKLEASSVELPSQVSLVISIQDDQAVTKYLPGNVNHIFAYDISLFYNGVEIQPNGKVTIRIPIPSDLDQSKMALYHIDDSGDREEMIYRIDAGDVVFETMRFSVYVLTDSKVSDVPSIQEPDQGNDSQPVDQVTNTTLGNAVQAPATGETTHIGAMLWFCFTALIVLCGSKKRIKAK